jgi:hypothetical protein
MENNRSCTQMEKVFYKATFTQCKRMVKYNILKVRPTFKDVLDRAMVTCVINCGILLNKRHDKSFLPKWIKKHRFLNFLLPFKVVMNVILFVIDVSVDLACLDVFTELLVQIFPLWRSLNNTWTATAQSWYVWVFIFALLITFWQAWPQYQA